MMYAWQMVTIHVDDVDHAYTWAGSNSESGDLEMASFITMVQRKYPNSDMVCTIERTSRKFDLPY